MAEEIPTLCFQKPQLLEKMRRIFNKILRANLDIEYTIVLVRSPSDYDKLPGTSSQICGN